jgi:Rieske Fe-S protein
MTNSKWKQNDKFKNTNNQKIEIMSKNENKMKFLKSKNENTNNQKIKIMNKKWKQNDKFKNTNNQKNEILKRKNESKHLLCHPFPE